MRPTPGFARKSLSRERCLSSVDNITAMIRHYRAWYSLTTVPLILVYSLALAATAVIFSRDGSTTSSQQNQASEFDGQINFIHKALKECSKTYDIALHVGEKLKKGTMDATTAVRGKGSDREAEALLDQHSSIMDFAQIDKLRDAELNDPGSWNPPWWNDDAAGLEGMEGDPLLNFGWSDILM